VPCVVLSSISLRHSLTQVNYLWQLVVSMPKQRRIKGARRKCYTEEHFSPALDLKLSVCVLAKVRALADNFELGCPILVSSVLTTVHECRIYF